MPTAIDTDFVREWLICCAILHLLVLGYWFAMFRWRHDWLYRLHSRWFALSPERFDALHYAGMALYKILLLVFFVVPALALALLR